VNNDPDIRRRNNGIKIRVSLYPLRGQRAARTTSGDNTFVFSPNFIGERRISQRLKARLEVAVLVGLAVLDTTSPDRGDTLLLLGATYDVSDEGLAIRLPAIRIDERYCEELRPLTLSLRLGGFSLQFELQTIHCKPLKKSNPDQGYIIGAKITDYGRLGSADWKRLVGGFSRRA